MTIDWITTAAGTPDPGYGARDDLRHQPDASGRMRDSLFWQMTMPDEGLGFQAYLYLTAAGKAGFNVAVWGAQQEPLALELGHGEIDPAMNLDSFRLGNLSLEQPDLRRTAVLRFESPKLKFVYDFSALHDAFSYRQNPDGLPGWFADNRLEQTGRVRGFLEIEDRRIEWDRIGHRDHSWGNRDWAVPHHWKWIVAYTSDGSRIVNLWIWVARGEWGFGGYVVRDGELVAIAHARQHAEYGSDMTQCRFVGEITDVRGGTTHLELDRFGLLRLPDNPKAGTSIMEAACSGVIDGAPAAGQFETHWPTEYLGRLRDSGWTA